MIENDDDYTGRHSINFAQAEGVEALPCQLKRTEITPSLRVKLWQFVYSQSRQIKSQKSYKMVFAHPYYTIYQDAWVEVFLGFADKYDNYAHTFIEHHLGPRFKEGDYISIFSLLQFIIRHRLCPETFSTGLQAILEAERAAFRIVNKNTFVPVGSPEEVKTIEAAISAAESAGLSGARSHLLQAASTATMGDFADSVRESSHAVESVARCLSPSGKLSDALTALEAKGLIHRAMRKGFEALYGYASDEKGVRHPLLFDGASAVNEADALFMLGACASFVSYMISRAREAGLISGDASP